MTKKQKFSEEAFKRIQQAEIAKNNGKTKKKSLTTKVQSEIDKAKNDAAQKQSAAQKLQNKKKKAKTKK